MSVYKRGNAWCVRIWYRGQKLEKSIGPDKKVALAVQAELEKERALSEAAGLPWTGAEKIQRRRRARTFREAAKDYLEERSDKKQSTLEQYRSILKVYLLPAFGKMPLSSITESRIRKFQSNLVGKRSERRINSIVQLLRSILGQAFRDGEISRDPSLSVKRLDEPKASIDPFSEEELKIALEAVDAHYRPFFITQMYTGARPNELIALRWSDIDWHNKTISITKGRVRGKEGPPKTPSSIREVPIVSPVEDALTDLKQRSVASLDAYVFTTKRGQPIHKHTDRVWSRALKKCGMRHRRSYQLRHTFATQCIIKGFPLPFIAKVLGHSTIDTLIRHYAGWIDTATPEHFEKLRSAFGMTSNSKLNIREI